MKKVKIKFLEIISIIFSSVLTMLSLVGATVAAASAINLINVDKESGYFIATDNQGLKYKCYNCTISGYEEGEDEDDYSASIEFLVDDNNNYPAGTYNIPQTLTHPTNGHVYTVRAINDGGFRYCNSTEIIIPNTVVSIGKEAFAYCEKITEIVLPYWLTKIESSTFLDCYKMENVLYYTKEGGRTLGNNNITEIGDHAFDSCKSLKNFYCPKNLTMFRQSCFQRCESFTSFYFPSENAAKTNKITIEPYAFADCPDLKLIYFEENMDVIRHHAFVECHAECEIHYTGQTDPSFDSHWRDINIATNLTDVITIRNKQSLIKQDNQYPGLYYVLESGKIKLDWGLSNTPIKYGNDK